MRPVSSRSRRLPAKPEQSLLIRNLSTVMVRFLLLGTLGLAGLQTLWPAAQPTTVAPVESSGSLDRSAAVQLALDQVVLSVKQYLRTGDPAERDDFSRRFTRFGELLDLFQISARDADSQRLMAAVRVDVTQIGALGQTLVAVPGAQSAAGIAQQMSELNELRDRAVLRISDVREATVRHIAQEADASSDLVKKLAGAGFATLVLSLGAATAIGRVFFGG